MKFRFYLPVLLACLTIFAGCGNHVAPGEILSYINTPSNGIVKEASINNDHVYLKYIPTDVQLLSDKASGMPAAELKDMRSRYDSFMYFRMTIQQEGESPVATQLHHLNFDMQEDLMLVAANGDTIPSTFCQKIVNGQRKQHEFMVVFERTVAAGSDFRFVYLDRTFGWPPVSLGFKGKDLANIPQL